jgi:two-component system NtrC family sensor kinase
MIRTGSFYLLLFLFSFHSDLLAQSEADSLKSKIQLEPSDTLKLLLLERVANIYSEINGDSAFYYGEKVLALAKKLNLPLEEVVALGEMGYAQLNLGNYPRSLTYLLSGIAIAENESSEKKILPAGYPATDDFTDRSKSGRDQRLAKLARIMQYAGILYGNTGNYEKAVYYFKTALPMAEESNNLRVLSITYTTLGRTYFSAGKKDSALTSLQLAYDFALKANYDRYLGSILLNTGRVYQSLGNVEKAREYYSNALLACTKTEYYRGVVASNLALADLFKGADKADTVLQLLHNGLAVANNLKAPDLFLRSYTALAAFYRNKGNNDSIVKYQTLIININDSLFNSKQVQQFQNIDFEAQQRLQEVENARKEYQNRMQIYLLLGGLILILLIALLIWRTSRNRLKTNALLQKHNDEIEKAMSDLKATQAQLIQSEKMASLGELTAGIAHEIQNPLNFVNNFSELNSELVDELGQAIDKGKAEGNSRLVAELLSNIKMNLEKITHHGKRADAIVKGMLQHSRAAAGEKESTNLNRLAEEYLRLAYSGAKSKNNDIEITLHTQFDAAISEINIVRQDIGKVLYNLYNNAFYAVIEKKKTDPDFTPEIKVVTRRNENSIQITVMDNGIGIPDKVIEKVFQPFFTTKPTGQGTGLGLSLAYDIVKAHGGEIKVKSEEGVGSEFVVVLF